MSLSLEKRVEACEAKINAILVGMNQILTDTTRIESAEQVQKEAPPDPKEYDKIFWEKTTGSSGEYEKTSKKSTQNHPIFQDLQERLKKHDGKSRFGPYFYWIFDKDPDVIGRKKVT